MLPTMQRRGPDAEGYRAWPDTANPRAVFGHRRLAILDLSPAGAQPMLSDDGRTGVVFNGCIYNFRAVRTELEACGRPFHSQCDTEVLVQGYLEWGIHGLLPRLHGMFAFAVWDDLKQTLFLARDRLGVKPLLFKTANGNIEFASTLQALFATGIERQIDPQSVMEFLEFGFVTDERCIVHGVDKLPPASVLEWHDGKASITTYWELPAFGSSPAVTFEAAVAETERLLVEAVRLRLVSDVPIGVLLSGGIDSTLVCWALAKLNTDVRAFTVGTPGDPSDESAHAAAIAKQLGILHEIVQIDTGEAPALPDLLAAFGEPFASTSALGMLRVSRAVRASATVLLTGDGADDVFLGYGTFRNAYAAQELANTVPSMAGMAWPALRPIASVIPAFRRGRNFLDYALGGIGPFARVRNGTPWYHLRGMFGERLRGRNVSDREVPASFGSARNILADVFQYHRRRHFLAEFLPKVDGGTMQYSLEARAPFLDQKLWEFAVQLSPDLHFRGGHTKAVLREIVRRHLGPEVAFRRKQGFTVPVETWLASRWSSQLERLKEPNILTADGWFDGPAVSRAIDRALASQNVPHQLWYLVVLENWMRHWNA
ncbi:MAG: asparagine synthase (glutamine-hydrolyzing) [Bryobacterales bacterium]|nr:asparagine synthase (glutamine-hydrolyzing) [Bryobacterales bacterium]